MADTQDRQAQAAQELAADTPATFEAAMGDQLDTWTKHVQQHVQLPDDDADGVIDDTDITVPMLVYGDGPNDYIATDIDAGQVMVRDGNDATGKAWKFPVPAFLRFVAHSQGKKLPGERDAADEGPNPLDAAIEQNKRTAASAQADREATQDAAKARGER